MSTTAQIARARWEALGTGVELVLGEAGALATARVIVERELAEIDRACSRFRKDSELSRLNGNGGRALRVDPLLIEATEVALRAAELTEGDVDPTLGVALELAGYDRDWRLLAYPPAGFSGTVKPTPQCPPIDFSDAIERAPQRPPGGFGRTIEPTPKRPPAGFVRTIEPTSHVAVTTRTGWQTVELDRERATLRIPPGVKLDLGATAKAWAADRSCRAVHDATGCGVLVSLGGDIATAGPSPAQGWRIHVTDNHRDGPEAPGQTISISSGGLATSSTAVRRWHQEGRAMHHIIDPSTGAPVASAWRTVSVAAADCTDANTAATAAIVRGERAPGWLAALRVPARLVRGDGKVVTVGSWPREGELW